ncbi:MAG: chromosome segregation protein SMC, partial [Erysipelotrichales bacterium]
YNIVTVDEASARSAISFLKRNESGRATFLPMTVLNEHYLGREHAIVAQGTEGYLGICADFVRCDEPFETLKRSLLGNVLVCDTLEHGNTLANMLKYNYKIVTLDGDVIHRGGSMTGGKQRDNASPLSMQKEITELLSQAETLSKQVRQYGDDVTIIRNKKSALDAELLEKRIAFAQLEPIADAKRAKYERLQNDLDRLQPTQDKPAGSFSDDLIGLLNHAYSRRDELNLHLRTKRDARLKIGQDSERRDQQIRVQRRDLNVLQLQKRDIELEKARNDTKLESQMNRLASEYQMTYEFAKQHTDAMVIENAAEEVLNLRRDIEALGNINMNAPQEFEEVNTRYEFLKKQYEELTSSRDKILDLIKELDAVMIVQFSDMMEKINHELPAVFTAMFGGGKAKLVLEDPADILNSGIDIDVQPPGKSVQNIRLFSGGEKSLIAISVLFAILKARHVPMCIFDEIEAALDPANVDRFARYLKSFSQETQFIVVTHRPGTMALCDVLYGVTMPQSGVSQMLKVKLAEAVTLAEEPEVLV